MEFLKRKVLEYLPSVGIALLILVIGYFATKLLLIPFKKLFKRMDLDPSLVTFFVRVIRVVCYVIIVIAALSTLGISTTGILASFSAGLAAVALALKDKLSDIASGIVILFTKPFITGDFIEFGAHRGFVQNIDLMHTKLLTYDDTNVIIPNSKISSHEVNNYTNHPEMRVLINVPVSYQADIETTKTVLYSTLNSTEKILTDDQHKPQVRLEKYGNSSLDYTVRCWCDFKDYWTVYYSLTERIKKALDENGIAIPFNQMNVHIIDEKKA